MALVCTDIQAMYGGFVAVDGVSLSVEGGHIVGVAGPNGAGRFGRVPTASATAMAMSNASRARPRPIERHGMRGAMTGCRAISNMGSHLSRNDQAGRWLVSSTYVDSS